MLRNKYIVCLLFFSLLFFMDEPVNSQELELQWWVSNMAMAKSALLLRDKSKNINLAGGWVCTVGPISKSNQACTTICRKNNETFEFSVMCNQNNPSDHIQIRFKNKAGILVDYIEVGCQPREGS